MTLEHAEKIVEFIMDDDLDFYEEYVIRLADELQEKFFDKNPEFMSQFQVNRDKMYLLKDKIFRDILRKIKRIEGGFIMALVKCPECGKEISDNVTRCSYCGVNIEEFESYNKKDKLNAMIKKVGLVVTIILLLFICISVVSSHFRMKTFEGYVDEFIHDWDIMAEAYQKEPKDLLTIDIFEKALCNDMRDISQSYVKFSNKTKVNDYLEKHVFKDMFEYVMELLKEEGREYSIDKEFIDFYTNMKR